MKVLMVHSEDSAVGMYRIWMPAKHLAKMGDEIRRLPNEMVGLPNDRQHGKRATGELKKTYKKYGSWEDMAEGVDLMVLQRADSPDAIALALAIRDQYNIPLVYEIDDNVYDVSANSPSYKYWFPGSPLLTIAETLMMNADAITTTTPQLVEVYKHLNPNIYVLPNCQDPDDWRHLKPAKATNEIIIGWAGGMSHYDDLQLIRRPIKQILRTYPNVRLRVIGTLPDFLQDIEGVELITSAVHCSKWPQKLSSLGFDIGLAPIVERPFNQGKSNIKWQEYAMLEIPTIASNFGPYKSITHNVDGLLASYNQYSWELQMTRLIEDEQLRRDLGRTAKQSVLANYNIASEAYKWHDAYADIIAKHQTKPLITHPSLIA